MIQRIQTLFLFLASAAFFLAFVFPFATSSEAGAGFLSDQLYNVFDHPALMALAGLGGLVALVSIFLFKNRGLQMRLALLTIVLSILLFVVAGLLVMTEQQGTAEYEESFGVALPILALIFGILANRFIQKDDKLVRSMDRLR